MKKNYNCCSFSELYFLLLREVLNERRANPPNPKPFDSLQMCIDAAGKDSKITGKHTLRNIFSKIP